MFVVGKRHSCARENQGSQVGHARETNRSCTWVVMMMMMMMLQMMTMALGLFFVLHEVHSYFIYQFDETHFCFCSGNEVKPWAWLVDIPFSSPTPLPKIELGWYANDSGVAAVFLKRNQPPGVAGRSWPCLRQPCPTTQGECEGHSKEM